MSRRRTRDLRVRRNEEPRNVYIIFIHQLKTGIEILKKEIPAKVQELANETHKSSWKLFFFVPICGEDKQEFLFRWVFLSFISLRWKTRVREIRKSSCQMQFYQRTFSCSLTWSSPRAIEATRAGGLGERKFNGSTSFNFYLHLTLSQNRSLSKCTAREEKISINIWALNSSFLLLATAVVLLCVVWSCGARSKGSNTRNVK